MIYVDAWDTTCFMLWRKEIDINSNNLLGVSNSGRRAHAIYDNTGFIFAFSLLTIGYRTKVGSAGCSYIVVGLGPYFWHHVRD